MKHERQDFFGSIFKFGAFIWLFNVVVTLAFVGILGYVAYHFLQKVW